MAAAAPAAVNPLRALSPRCEVRVAAESERADMSKLRMRMSKEEIDIINNGGNDVSDWRKIKM